MIQKVDKNYFQALINNNSVLYTLHEQITKDSSCAILMINCRPVTTTYLVKNTTKGYVTRFVGSKILKVFSSSSKAQWVNPRELPISKRLTKGHIVLKNV